MRALFFRNGGALLIVECERCALERIPEHTQCSTLFCRWWCEVVDLVWCCVWIFTKPLHTGWFVCALDGPHAPADLTAFGLRFKLCSIPALRQCGLVRPANEPVLDWFAFVLARDDELVMSGACHGCDQKGVMGELVLASAMSSRWCAA